MNNKQKDRLLPPMGFEFKLGTYVFKVTYRNVGQVRFTATLIGRVVEEEEKPAAVIVGGSSN